MEPRAFTDEEEQFALLIDTRLSRKRSRETSAKKREAIQTQIETLEDRLVSIVSENSAKVSFVYDGFFTVCHIFLPDGTIACGVSKRMTIDPHNETIGNGRALKRALLGEAISLPAEWKVKQ